MKNKVSAIITAIICMAGCQMNVIEEPTIGHTDFIGKTESFEKTKTSLDENNNIRWSTNDELLIFKGSTLGSIYKISDESAGQTSASFEYVGAVSEGFSAGTALEHNIAFYPMGKAILCAKADASEPVKSYELSNIVIPSEQTYAVNSFAQGAFPMVAVTESTDNYELNFKNILGGLKLQLMGECSVQSITISGNESESLAGEAKVTAYVSGKAPEITLSDNTSTAVTLECKEPVQLSMEDPTEFIIALPPMEFTEGFIVTVTDANGNDHQLSTTKSNTVYRSSLLKMPVAIIGDVASEYITVSQPEKTFTSEGADFEVTVMSNIDYEVQMPDVDWLTEKSSEASVHSFSIATNKSNETRTAEIVFKATDSDKQCSVIIKQYSDNIIHFEDELMELCCVLAYDTDNDGKLSFSEAAAVTSLNDMDVSLLWDAEVSFDEFKYFTSVKMIPGIYFEDTYIEYISFPESLRALGPYAFEAGVGTVNFNSIEQLFALTKGEGNYFEKIHVNGAPLTEVTIPSGITEIPDEMFCCNTALTSVIISEGVTKIGQWAFSDCESLESITIPSTVTHIGKGAFACTKIHSITLPENIEEIESRTFELCEYLKNIIIPDNVKSIGERAFEDCSSLEEITLPTSLKHIYSDAFNGCIKLKKVHVESIRNWCNINFELGEGISPDLEWFTCKSNPVHLGADIFIDGSIVTEITIPEGVTEVKDNAFIMYKSLTKVTIPSTVIRIGKCAFYKCSNLETVEFSEGLEEIGDYAFYNCSNATVHLPESVNVIGEKSLTGTSLKLPNLLTVTSKSYDEFEIVVSIPDDVISRGNAIRHTYCNLLMYNYNRKKGNNDYFSLLWNGQKHLTENTRIAYPAYDSDPITPGEPIVYIAGEFSWMTASEADENYDFHPDWVEGYYMPLINEDYFSTSTTYTNDKLADRLDEYWEGAFQRLFFELDQPEIMTDKVEINVTDITSDNALIEFTADNEIYAYNYIVLNDNDYNELLDLLNGEEKYKQWAVTSYFAHYYYAARTEMSSSSTSLKDLFYQDAIKDGPKKYHILVTSFGDWDGTIQSFNEYEFELPSN